MIAAALLLSLLPTATGEGAPTWREVAPVPPEGAPDESARLEHPRGVERALSDIVLENGDRARLWNYGVSSGGCPLLALELHAERFGGGWRPGEGPTIVVVADLERDAAAGVHDVVAWARRLAADDASLEHARWLLVPAPAPDRLAGAEPEVALAWDFPFGWDAWSTPGAGSYPLRAPETRALATGLGAWGTGAALVVLGTAERRGGASLEAYARALGWDVLGLAEAGTGGDHGGIRRARALVDRLALEPLSVRRATSELWEVEIRVPARVDARARGVQLEVSGVRLLAAARRSGADALPLPVDLVRGVVTLAYDGSEGAVVSLLLRGLEADGVRVRLVGRSAAPCVTEMSLAEKAASTGD